MTNPSWQIVNEVHLYQGDFLPDCYVPRISIPTDIVDPGQTIPTPLDLYDLIVLTHSCDLNNPPEQHSVLTCTVTTVEEYEKQVPAMKKYWNDVLRGRREGLYLLPSPLEPGNNQKALVADFRSVFSLPFSYLKSRAELLGDRHRLQSPFLEHFSQAFARFFMRVGLPSEYIPKFK